MALVNFDKASAGTITGPCGFSLALPSFTFTFGIPSPAWLQQLALIAAGFPSITLPTFSFKLQCDPANPIDISVGQPYGGGRTSNIPPAPPDT